MVLTDKQTKKDTQERKVRALRSKKNSRRVQAFFGARCRME